MHPGWTAARPSGIPWGCGQWRVPWQHAVSGRRKEPLAYGPADAPGRESWLRHALSCQFHPSASFSVSIANQTGGIVIGTGDMSELALGWATYNGDHMSMYGVNASVPKTLVRHLVHYFADTCEDSSLKEVLYDVLDTPVSPELLPPKDGEIAQKTEDLVGPYELHDFFLYYFLRIGYEPGKIYRIAKLSFAGEYDDETIYKWLRTFCWRFFSQQFKRSCLPDGPKVGTVALSPRGDWRMPSDACVALWIQNLEKEAGK